MGSDRERPRNRDTTAPLLRDPEDGELRLRLEAGGGNWIVGRARLKIVLGRDPENDVVLDGEYVSRRHGTIEYRSGEFRLTDTSTNGSVILPRDGAPIEVHRDSALLEGRGRIVLGHRDGVRLDFAVECYSLERRGWQGSQAHIPHPVDQGGDVFRLEGDYWLLRYDGQMVRLKDTKGMRLIAHLLAHPGQEFHALDLTLTLADTTEPTMLGDRGQEFLADAHVADEAGAGPLLDAGAKAAYKERLADLREELEEAERFNDLGRKTRVEEEIEFLANQLARAIGLGGRDRPVSSNAERARVMVTHRVRDTLKKIRQIHPSLGAHLGKSIRTGNFCSYSPNPSRPGSWSF